MARYKQGDKVWITVRARENCWRIVATLGTGRLAGTILGEGTGPVAFNMAEREQLPVYAVDVEGRPLSEAWVAVEAVLSPRHDPYDGDLAGAWSFCVYNPHKKVPV